MRAPTAENTAIVSHRVTQTVRILLTHRRRGAVSSRRALFPSRITKCVRGNLKLGYAVYFPRPLSTGQLPLLSSVR